MEVKEASKLQKDFKATRSWFDITPNILKIEFDFNSVSGNQPAIRTTYASPNGGPGVAIISRTPDALTLPEACISFTNSIACDEDEAGKDAVGQIITLGLKQFVDKQIIRKMDLEIG